MPKCKSCDIEYSQSIDTSPIHCSKCNQYICGEDEQGADILIGLAAVFVVVWGFVFLMFTR